MVIFILALEESREQESCSLSDALYLITNKILK